MWKDWPHQKEMQGQTDFSRRSRGARARNIWAVWTKSRSSAYMITVKVNGHMLEMIVDTGAVVSVVPEWMYQKYLAHLPLVKVRNLRSYSGDRLELLGKSTVTNGVWYSKM